MKTILYTLTLLGFLFGFTANSWAATQYTGVINVNTASLEQIMLLPGIGSKKAQAIAELRSKKAFTKIEELLLVDGIGEALFAKIKAYLVLDGATTLQAAPMATAPK
jgi:competence protein ComEA